MNDGNTSWREIARRLNIPKSSVSDFLRKIVGTPPVEIPRPRILFFDIETAPMLAYAWKRWKENISQSQVVKEGYMLTYSAKWKGDNNYIQGNITQVEDDKKIVEELSSLINQSDLIVAHNIGFDLSTLKARMVFYGMKPLKPVRLIDTWKIAKQEFRFPSNSLDSLADYLSLGNKKKHSGFDMWKACMALDEQEMAKMLEYNAHDVFLLEQVYDKLAPWASSIPSVAPLYSDGESHCPLCGSTHLSVLDKQAHTNMSSFIAYQCDDCGKVSRSRKNTRSKEDMQSTLMNVM